MNQKSKHFDVIIVGGGPAGLACAKKAAEAGYNVALFERKGMIGQKVCAGGITWNGLRKYYPHFKTEKDFSNQFIYTSFQSCSLNAKHPIVSTVDRIKLGNYMKERAADAGASIFINSKVKKISEDEITVSSDKDKKLSTFSFSYLVGADGSSSPVRRFLKLPINDVGVGINYFLPKDAANMAWHIKPSLFKNGYGWIFPHKDKISIGAYCPRGVMKAAELKVKCCDWAKSIGYDLKQYRPSAELINFDFKGLRFGRNKNIFLIGDAAGLASALTGEGIYPAIVSGEGVVDMIKNNSASFPGFESIIKSHRKHRRIVNIAGKSKLSAVLLSELMAFGYRNKILNFSSAEMA